MADEVFKSLWVGDALSPFEQMCIASFLDLGLEFHLFTYGPVEGVPGGCTVREAGQVVPESKVFQYSKGRGKGSYAGFANLFRYELLHQEGGFWVDTDVLALKRPSIDDPIAFAFQDERQVNNAILKAPSGHELMAYCAEKAKAAGKNIAWGETGPKLLTEAVQRHGLDSMARPTADFYPVPYQRWSKLIRRSACAELEELTSKATFVHLWAEMFRRVGYDKAVAPPEGSYLDQQMVRLLDHAPRYRYIEHRTERGIRMQKSVADPTTQGSGSTHAMATGARELEGLDPRIQLSHLQISVIARAIAERQGRASLLVYGCGFDSPLWAALNRAGVTVFVEHDPTWAERARALLPKATIETYEFADTTVAETAGAVDLPRLESVPTPDFVTAHPWDVVLIDGPSGYHPNDPGRALPLFWTHRHVGPACDIFVDDFDRPLERLYSQTFFGTDDQLFTLLRGTIVGRHMLWRVGLPEIPAAAHHD